MQTIFSATTSAATRFNTGSWPRKGELVRWRYVGDFDDPPAAETFVHTVRWFWFRYRLRCCRLSHRLNSPQFMTTLVVKTVKVTNCQRGGNRCDSLNKDVSPTWQKLSRHECRFWTSSNAPQLEEILPHHSQLIYQNSFWEDKCP